MSKLNSRKFWIVLWACFVLTAWGTYSMLTEIAPIWMTGAVALLIAIPAAYVGIGTAKKKQEDK